MSWITEVEFLHVLTIVEVKKKILSLEFWNYFIFKIGKLKYDVVLEDFVRVEDRARVCSD